MYSKRSNNPAVNYTSVVASGTPVENTNAQNKCAICDLKHFVLWCPKFKPLSTEEKVDTVKRLRLCFNCLGRHKVQDCTNKNRCQKCGAMHHTEIHFVDGSTIREQKVSPQDSATSQATRPEESTSKQVQ